MADETPARQFVSRILSGIQPTGELHLGNYLGAIRNWVALQDTDAECFYCVVDYHAITADHDPEVLRKRTLDMARDLIACGVDPTSATLFIQSDVPEHAELAWIFASVTAYGDLTRMTQFKDKGEKQEFVSVGLFTYPVLQAADILAYQATGVPVGEDQVQHLELCRGIARRFNAKYGEMFPETEPILTPTSRIMSLADPSQKMSKSLGDQHFLGIFEDESSFQKKIKRAVTATGGEALAAGEIPPGVANLLGILGAVAPADVTEPLTAAVQAGQKVYGDLKKAVGEHLDAHLRPIRERQAALKESDVLDVVREGGRKAREVARAVLDEARDRIGLARL